MPDKKMPSEAKVRMWTR